MPVLFNRPVSHPEQPQGNVATQLRELINDSDIASSAELRRRTNYAGSTLSEALGGRKRQNRNVITKIVEACVADREEASELVEELMSILETQPPGSGTEEVGEVTERAPSPAETVATSGGQEEPLDPAEQAVEPPAKPSEEIAEQPDVARPLPPRQPAAAKVPEQGGAPEAERPEAAEEAEPALAGVGARGVAAAAVGSGAGARVGEAGSGVGGRASAPPAPAADPAADPAPGESGGPEAEGEEPPAAVPDPARHWYTVEHPADDPPGEGAGGGLPPGGRDRPGRGWGPRRRPWLWAGAAVVLVVALVAAVLSFVGSQQPMCGPGVTRQDDGQCIGVTDGSVNVAADQSFDTLFAKIRTENARVLNAADRLPVVSVAYAAPFPATRTGVSGQLLREIEGAYLMQLQANEAGGLNPLGGPPRVQLLIANLGATGSSWPEVVGTLKTRTVTSPDNPVPVVAVAGIDQSLPAVKEAIAALGQAQIPMVAGRLVADDISADPVRDGFFGVAPSVNQQVTAAARYLGTQAQRPLLVEDTTTKDLYGRNIAAAFTQAFTATSVTGRLPNPVPFDSGRAGLQGAFANVLPAVCQLRPDAVFYAGRGTNLPAFIQALGIRVCKDVPVTVYTASDGRLLSSALRDELADPSKEKQLNEAMTGGIRVIVTAQAHPGVWNYPALVPKQSYATLTGSFATAFTAQFPDQRQVDAGGDVIMGHDAMQVVVEAIRRGVPPQSDEPVTADIVRQALGGITSYTPVYGASGPIAFRIAGYAENKNIPITEITPDGTITLVNPSAP